MLIAVIVPAELTTAVAAAETVVTPVLNISLLKVIFGLVVYQTPPTYPSELVRVTIPITLSPITEVAAAPLPP